MSTLSSFCAAEVNNSGCRQGCGSEPGIGASEPGTFPGAGAQIKNQKEPNRSRSPVYNVGPEPELWPFER